MKVFEKKKVHKKPDVLGYAPAAGLIRRGGTKPYTNTPRPDTTPKPYHTSNHSLHSSANEHRVNELVDLIIALHDELKFGYVSAIDDVLHSLCMEYDSIRQKTNRDYSVNSNKNVFSSKQTEKYSSGSVFSGLQYQNEGWTPFYERR